MPEPRVVTFPREPGPPPPPAAGEGWIAPFTWRDPSTIPPRRWLYGGHYIRRFVSVTLAPGGVGKSALVLGEALAMVSGRPLFGIAPDEPELRVWAWNGEDPIEETERRLVAAGMHHGVLPAAMERGLFIGSGRDADLVIAEQTRDGVEINAPNIDALKELISLNCIDVVIIDPFVASHRVPENDNGAIDRVVKQWARLAEECNVSVELVHHVRKGQPGAETTVEDGRGAVALLAAARSARVLNVMTESEAEKAGVERRRSYFRVTNGKANLAPPPDRSDWYRFVSIDLGNGGTAEGRGDSVGVVTAWRWPDHAAGLQAEDVLKVQQAIAAGEWRSSSQARDWAGHAIAQALEVDLSAVAGKARVGSLLRMWLQSGALTTERVKDKKGTDREWVRVGEWVNPVAEVFA